MCDVRIDAEFTLHYPLLHDVRDSATRFYFQRELAPGSPAHDDAGEEHYRFCVHRAAARVYC